MGQELGKIKTPICVGGGVNKTVSYCIYVKCFNFVGVIGLDTKHSKIDGFSQGEGRG